MCGCFHAWHETLAHSCAQSFHLAAIFRPTTACSSCKGVAPWSLLQCH
jgi:hypothetical protein